MKIYLNTIEDLTKALSEGKVVYEADGKNTKPFFKHWIVNGIVISKFIAGFYDYSTYIGYQFRVDADTIFYYEEKEPLKIEIGKFYKTRSGEKAICLYIDNNRKGDTHIYKMYRIGQAKHYWVDSRGNKDCGFYLDSDIVDYWKDEVK